jgi:hypothetical protein
MYKIVAFNEVFEADKLYICIEAKRIPYPDLLFLKQITGAKEENEREGYKIANLSSA